MNHFSLSRRSLLQRAFTGTAVASLAGTIRSAAAQSAATETPRACILLWMSGGPSQLDTFDPKPEHANGGEFEAIDTSVSGVRIAEHLPELAKRMEHLAIVRSMSTKEGDHTRGSFYMRTGYLPQGPIQYPTLGSFISRELARRDAELPGFVSVSPYRFLSPAAFSPGFLGPKFAPLIVGGAAFPGNDGGDENYLEALRVENLEVPAGVSQKQAQARLELLGSLEHDFLKDRPGTPGQSHTESYRQATRMVQSGASQAFALDGEPDALRDAYGRNLFGQGCLLARRLVERGVPFVEVSLNGVNGAPGAGWDTHASNFESVKNLCGVLDPAFATLVNDLSTRGLLDSTLIVWMGEFGRTPKINDNAGRDHWPKSWSTVLAGGGIRGGQVYGATTNDGTDIAENAVDVPSFMATICSALGVDHNNQNISNVGRPIPLADHGAEPIADLLG